MKLFEFYCYRRYLKLVLKSRQETNKNYSLRAFAKQLDISPSRLSDVLNEKNHFGHNNVKKIALKLFKCDRERDFFLTLYQCQRVKDSTKSAQLLQQLEAKRLEHSFQELEGSLSQEKKWYHFTILMILSINHEVSLTSLALILKLSESTVANAINELRKMKLISGTSWRINANHRFISIDRKQSFNADFHGAMIHKSLDALRRTPIEERWFNSLLFTMPEKDYKELCANLENTLKAISIRPKRGKHDSVYALTAQLFPLARFDQNLQKTK